MRSAWFLVAVMVCGACGGGQSGSQASPGQPHATASGDVPRAGEGAVSGEFELDAGVPADAGPPPPPVVFRLTNTAEEDLVFSVEKGWQPIIAAWHGEPPKATPIILFPKYCTASCDEPEDAVCPYCPEPETNKARKALEEHVVVAPGESLDVPWDAMAYAYEKTKGTQVQQEGGRARKARCECWRQVEPEPNDYTVQVCGLRVTKEAGKRSKYQCIRVPLTLPLGSGEASDAGAVAAETGESVVVEVAFPTPEEPKPKKRRRRRR